MSGLFNNPTRVFLLIAGFSVAAVAAALVTQHGFDMQPCPWCVLQRLIFLAIALVALVGVFWRLGWLGGISTRRSPDRRRTPPTDAAVRGRDRPGVRAR